MIICDLYVRVSSIEQAEEGYSLGEQEERLRAYAAAQGWAVNACYVDPGFSGAKLDRPGLQQIIRDATLRRVQKVVTYKLDRLSRSQKDTLYLIEDVFIPNGVDYVSMTESLDTGTAFGMAMIGILSVFAQLEREQIKERMTLGRIASAKEGNWRGGSGVPIGYRYIPQTATEDGHLVIDSYEAEIVRKVFDLFLRGKTYHAIHAYCHKHYTTSYGDFGGGGASLIPRMLSNRAYIGEIKYCGIWYKGKHDPIIDQATFQRAQDKMVEYQSTLDAHRRAPFRAEHLLSGLLYCGECGGRWCYHGCHYITKSGERRNYGTYCCYTKNAHAKMRKADHCSIPVWSDVELERVVWEQVLGLRYDDLQQEQDDDARELAAIEARAEEIDRQRARLVDLYALGNLPIEAIQDRATKLTEERERLTAQRDIIRRRSTRLSADELSDALGRVSETYANGTVEEQRDLLTMLIKKIILHHERRVEIVWNI